MTKRLVSPKRLLSLWLGSAAFWATSVLAGPSVNVGLQASFEAPPFIIELLETAAEENSTSYFPLLDRIAEGRFAECATDEELYNTFVQTLQEDRLITTSEALSSFRFALAIHAAVPRIEAHYQFYDTSVEPSLMVAQDAACPVWIHFQGDQYCSPTLDRAQQGVPDLRDPEFLPFDRLLDASPSASALPSVLYADITSPLFAQFHQTVSSTARAGQTTYRIRYRRSQESSHQPVAVNGYGVELALKRTDYIVIDDRKTEKGDDEEPVVSESEGSAAESKSEDLVDEEVTDLKPLSSSELRGLGLKASSFVMQSNDPLSMLERLSQDFPKHSASIAKHEISHGLFQEHKANRALFLPAGYNVIWMNGQQVQAREVDAFSLLEQLRRERGIVQNLRGLGLTGSQAVQMLSHSIITESKVNANAQRYDYRDDVEGGGIIIWLNDVEKDKRYSDWPSETSALLQRLWPGQLPQVRRDIHNAIVPIDFTAPSDIVLLVENLQLFIRRKVPVRFGIVPLVASDAARDQAITVYHLLETYGIGTVIAYLEACLKTKGKEVKSSPEAFNTAVKDRKLRRDREAMSLQNVLASPALESLTQKVKAYTSRLGIKGSPPPFFINGVALARNDEWLQGMSGAVDNDLRTLQREVYLNQIPEDSWLAGRYLENATTYRNALIIPEDDNDIEIVDIARVIAEHNTAWIALPRLRPLDESKETLYSQAILIADLDSKAGLEMLSQALEFYKLDRHVELIVIHNGEESRKIYSPLSALISRRMGDPTSELDAESLDALVMLAKSLLSDDSPIDVNDSLAKEDREKAASTWQSYRPLIPALRAEVGETVLLVSGRVVGPIPDNSSFSLDDFQQLFRYEQSRRLGPAASVLEELSLLDHITTPDEAAILVSTLALSTISDIPEGIFESGPTLRMDKFKAWTGDKTMIQTGEAESSSIHLVASIDPTSQIAQRWIPILRVLSELDGVQLQLYLNPKDKIEELPIKRFYRHVLDSRPKFGEQGERMRLGATFDRLPRDALLNLGLDVPPAWLVAPKESIHDLDNIKLSALKDGANIDATYELEYILIEGHSRDVTVGPPPRGVQLVLGTAKAPYFADTIIMANVGYFQFKANPGFWHLRLQQGRSSKIFSIDSAGQLGYSPTPGDESTDITLMSFKGRTLYPRLSRRPGQEQEDVLEEGGGILTTSGKPAEIVSKAGSFASSLLSKVGLGGALSKPTHADINIFSVASGHLYERMLNIMMVSVIRHTNKTVKFWFIAQFLSPSFKASLPYLAAHYNFSYELITYKWPHWLRQQSEKQREIWGYKILFLDVLFPTSLDKVIFVDADQIVRTDMNDLVNFDLEGAPYGFTPMGDSRTEMEGFRFWKQGYWANFLRGLPYHISALYVVDLRKFRQIAAGDRLRGQYHQLSADPGSLSNLDQDLPNHMQHVLPIKSLPKEWLWCETWCADDELANARTIDLCNNPQTKEPKLSRARRQVPEWTELDDEIAGVLRGVREKAGEVRGGVQEVMIEGVVADVKDGGKQKAETAVSSAQHGKETSWIPPVSGKDDEEAVTSIKDEL